MLVLEEVAAALVVVSFVLPQAGISITLVVQPSSSSPQAAVVVQVM
jgi:hypothetical protein